MLDFDALGKGGSGAKVIEPRKIFTTLIRIRVTSFRLPIKVKCSTDGSKKEAVVTIRSK
jgi:hypothetical protein